MRRQSRAALVEKFFQATAGEADFFQIVDAFERLCDRCRRDGEDIAGLLHRAYATEAGQDARKLAQAEFEQDKFINIGE